jgi:hypothetical protein
MEKDFLTRWRSRVVRLATGLWIKCMDHGEAGGDPIVSPDVVFGV